MKLRLLPLLLAVAVTGPGCIIQHDATSPGDALNPSDNGGYGNGYANLTFDWTFEGRSCADASVQTVVVTIPGEILQSDGRYPCSSATQDGITLENFFPGTYSYTLSAYDVFGNLVYEASGQVSLDGWDQVESVDLVAVEADAGVNHPPPGGLPGDDAGVDGGSGAFDGGSGAIDGGSGEPDGGSVHPRPDGGDGANAVLSWSFPQVPNAPVCGGELTQVVVTIDGTATSYDCAAGLAPAEITTPALSLGTHSVKLEAEGADGTVWATTEGSLDVSCSCTTSAQNFELPWVVGSAGLDWIFFDSAHQNPTTSCDTAGVETMAANFEDSAGQWLFADAQGNPADNFFGCTDSGGFEVYRALPPGDYTVFLAGYGPNICVTYSAYPDETCYQASVQAGVFLSAGSYPDGFVSIDLDKQ